MEMSKINAKKILGLYLHIKLQLWKRDTTADVCTADINKAILLNLHIIMTIKQITIFYRFSYCFVRKYGIV